MGQRRPSLSLRQRRSRSIIPIKPVLAFSRISRKQSWNFFQSAFCEKTSHRIRLPSDNANCIIKKLHLKHNGDWLPQHFCITGTCWKGTPRRPLVFPVRRLRPMVGRPLLRQGGDEAARRFIPTAWPVLLSTQYSTARRSSLAEPGQTGASGKQRMRTARRRFRSDQGFRT